MQHLTVIPKHRENPNLLYFTIFEKRRGQSVLYHFSDTARPRYLKNGKVRIAGRALWWENGKVQNAGCAFVVNVKQRVRIDWVFEHCATAAKIIKYKMPGAPLSAM